MAGFADLGNQFRAVYSNFTIGQKVSIVIMLVLLGVLFGSLMFWAGRPELHVLYSKLSPEDAQSVVSDLEGKVKYQLKDNGTTVLVPKDAVYKLRLDLASKGLPKGGVVGFEIFDKATFGVTDFTQRVNYKRAIEGELTRTITQLDTVSSAKVIIALPEKTLFTEEKEEPSASIVLGLSRAGALSKNQTQGIVYLVSSSVEGLAPGKITVIDTSGRILYKGSSDTEAELASTQYEFKKQYETNLEKKISSMLGKVIGANKSVAMVSAEFDFAAVNKTEEIFDPEGVVVISEQRSSDTTSNQTSAPAGVPGVRGNIPPTAAAAGGARAATSTGKKSSETINYEVSKTVRSTKEAVGELTKLSISLIVDGVYKEAEAAEGEEAGAEKKLVYSPRSDEALEQIRVLVMSAVGFDEERGDLLEVESMQFMKDQVEAIEGKVAVEEKESIWQNLGKYAFSAVVILLVILFVVMPLTKWMSQVPQVPMAGMPTVAGAPAGITGVMAAAEPQGVRMPGRTAEDIEREREAEVKALEAEIAGESTIPEGAKRKQAIKSRLSHLTDKDPDSVAQLLKTWMHED